MCLNSQATSRIANSELSVQNLRMRVGDSDIKGEGRFNLDTYAYSVNAEGKNIDLAQVASAASESLVLAGKADVNVTGQGKWGSNDDWSELNLNATIQGQDVSINGRDVGDAKIVAFTESGLLKVEATGNVLDQPRTLAATIDLRDRKELSHQCQRRVHGHGHRPVSGADCAGTWRHRRARDRLDKIERAVARHRPHTGRRKPEQAGIRRRYQRATALHDQQSRRHQL